MFRFEWRDALVPEGGIGVHLFANRAAGRLGTVFEFGDVAGIGVRLSPRWLLGYRFLHFSNAGIRQPNGGVNIHSLHIEYAY
ncbi:MAG: acyloxyacyl hydrolase [Mariprofundaceae bacterium]|nr:acyloxyacyl hydrolase [Mariprofundaceae bacterium]